MTQCLANRLAPVALFAYNRPEHTRRTLKALAANDLAGESVLYVYADGPKPFASEDDQARLAQVRDVVRSQSWCGEVVLVESEWNRGLAANIVRGVTEVVQRHGRVIVLEDDIVTRPGFLRFMNGALDLYADEPRVMHISGMIFGTPQTPGPATALLRIMSCHGWATWRRAWDHYTADQDLLFARLKAAGITRKRFDIEGHAHFYRQLEKNRDGTLNTWAVKWYASWLTVGGYSLFPRRSLLSNVGQDGSGVHGSSAFFNGATVDSLSVERMPVVEDVALRKEQDQIWRDGLRAMHAPRRLTLRQIAARALSPLRGLGRHVMRFLYPELRFLDAASPDCVVSPNSTARSTVSPSARLYPPYHIRDSTIGDGTYLARNSWVSLTRIGRYCSVGPNLMCGWGCHPTDGLSTSPAFYSTRKQNGATLCTYDKVQEQKPIDIGNDVFIGMNVTILDGVTIGDGAVIGAGAVVVKDIPPYAIAVGNPARVVRYRFSEEVIAKLLRIEWWDWPEERLREVERSFFDVDAFAARHDPGVRSA